MKLRILKGFGFGIVVGAVATALLKYTGQQLLALPLPF